MLVKKILPVFLFLLGSTFLFPFPYSDPCFGESSDGKSQLQLTNEEKNLISLGKRLKEAEKKVETWDQKVEKAKKSK